MQTVFDKLKYAINKSSMLEKVELRTVVIKHAEILEEMINRVHDVDLHQDVLQDVLQKVEKLTVHIKDFAGTKYINIDKFVLLTIKEVLDYMFDNDVRDVLHIYKLLPSVFETLYLDVEFPYTYSETETYKKIEHYRYHSFEGNMKSDYDIIEHFNKTINVKNNPSEKPRAYRMMKTAPFTAKDIYINHDDDSTTASDSEDDNNSRRNFKY
jgi:hypothetical protein